MKLVQNLKSDGLNTVQGIVKNPPPLEPNDEPIVKTGVPNPNEYKSIPKALRTKRVMKQLAKEEKAKSAAKKKTAKKK